MSNQADDKSSYHYIRGERVELDMSATTFSVRFQKGAHSRLPSLQVSYQHLFRGELIPLELIGDYRLYIYQTTQPLPRKNEALRTVRDGLLDKIMQLSMISIIDGTIFTIFDRNEIFGNSGGELATPEKKRIQILVQKEKKYLFTTQTSFSSVKSSGSIPSGRQ